MNEPESMDNGAESYGLHVFDSTNMALKYERALKSALVLLAVIPTPVEITAECGIALLLNDSQVARAKEAIEAAGLSGHTLVYPFERKLVERGKEV